MYDGSKYVGWQRQKNGLSIQEVLEEVLSLQRGESISAYAAGRTDSGVHALGMVVHVDTSEEISMPKDFIHKANSHLPPDIAITALRKVIPNAHVRYDAFERAYQYRVSLFKNPFERNRSWILSAKLDVKKMIEASTLFQGAHDFSAFCSARSETENKICHLTKLIITEQKGYIIFEIRADRFLMNMVRNIVGTLIEIGKGKRALEDVTAILASRDRTKCGIKAPAEGLYFLEALYPAHIFEDSTWYECF